MIELLNALFYGMNKGIDAVMGSSPVIGRIISRYMMEFFERKGVVRKNMTDEEIRKLFVEKFGLAEDLKIYENSDSLKFEVVKPKLRDFLEEVLRENVRPHVCPFVGLLAQIYSYSKNVKIMLLNVDVKEDNVILKFKKVG